MKASPLEFRFRIAINTVLCLLGFVAPWERFTSATRVVPLWSWLAVQLAHLHLLTTGAAYLLVTIAAIACLFAGALVRVWGTAYLGNSVVRSGSMHGREVVAAGPYRHVRNPLYLGSFLNAAGISILMPPTGALFFLIAIGVFMRRLIGGEEAYLTQQLGDSYIAYTRVIPRLLPRLSPGIAAGSIQPRWLPSLAGEVFPIGIALCFTALAWRYDADLLTRCVIITFGVSLVTRAMMAKDSVA